MCNFSVSVCVHTRVFVHTYTSENKYTCLESYNFSPLLVHAGRYCLKVKLLEDIMLTTVAETAEIAEVSKIFL